MATTEQINANRENAKHSSGPASDAGKQTSSRNATRLHGPIHRRHSRRTRTLRTSRPASPAQYEPTNHQQEQLAHQIADLEWSLHQISVQQLNTISLMNAVQVQCAEQLPQGAEMYKFNKAKNQAWEPLQFGFVCSLEEIDLFISAGGAVKAFKP